MMMIALFSVSTLESEAQKETKVLLQTSMGDIKIILYDQTPLHRDNFVKLVQSGYYDGLLFHRVIKNFMIQGGDPDSKNAKKGQSLGVGGPNYKIPAEINAKLLHKKGALAAARQGDQVNPKKESSGSQFYIVQGQKFDDATITSFENQSGIKFTPEQKKVYKTFGGTPHLDGAYTVFGEVIQGLEIIDKIAAVATDRQNRPLEDVKIIKATIVK